MQHLGFVLIHQKPRALGVQHRIVRPEIRRGNRKAAICLELPEGRKCLPGTADNLYGGQLIQPCISVCNVSITLA